MSYGLYYKFNVKSGGILAYVLLSLGVCGIKSVID